MARMLAGLLALSLLATGPAAQDADEHVAERHGFALRRPDRGWAFAEKTEGGQYVLTCGPTAKQGTVAVSVRVRAAGDATDPVSVRDGTLASVRGQPGYGAPALEVLPLAGQKAPAFLLDQPTAAGPYRVRQGYLLREGLLYTVNCYAPKGDFAKWWPHFQRALAGFRFVPLPERPDAALEALAARCGSEIPWEETWDAAARRAEGGRRLILVVIRLLAGFNISDPTRAGVFMDEDVRDLARERCVAWRFARGQSPLEAPERYGIGPHGFGTTVLLVTPQGRVVGDTAMLEPHVFADWLRARLAEHAAASAGDDQPGLTGAPRAHWHLRRGEYDAARAVLAELPVDDAEAHRARFHLARRERRGPEALALARDDPALALDLRVLDLRMGHFTLAAEWLPSLAAEAGERQAEARYWLGAARFRTGGKPAAERVWRDLARDHAESRWAWLAAATLTSTLFQAGGAARVTWPDPVVVRSLDIVAPSATTVAEATAALADARTYLLRTQRADGSWIDPGEAGAAEGGAVSPFTFAITALAGRALLARPDDAEARAAATRALAWGQAVWARWQAAPPRQYFMDYTNWSDACWCGFLADALAARLAERAALAPVIAQAVASLAAKQRANGGWSYYLTSDLDGGRAGEQSISFVTAFAILALAAAERAGVTTAAAPRARAVECLRAMRLPDATFAYLLYVGKPATASGGPDGAAGRGPLCEWALQAGPERVAAALDRFAAVRATYAAEQGKTLMHGGRDGQGSHYLLFDYAMAAGALATLPASEAARRRGPLIELVLAARGADGSFQDTPIKGRHYGTAMAVLALTALTE